MAPLIHALRAEPLHFRVQVCVTAQHRHMLDQVLKIFDVVPDIDLDLMKPGQDLFDVTANVLKSLKVVFEKFEPDVVLVHGDTTTTMAAAMAAFYMNIPIGHVEAGLRTHDIKSPFPEEFNRQVTSKVARWHFSPTELSRVNLLAEGVSDKFVTVAGNTVIDALHWVLDRIDSDSTRREALSTQLGSILPFDWRTNRFVLITGHRRENFGEGFLQICDALRVLALRFPDEQFVFPVHLNPNVQTPVSSMLAGLANVHLIDPLEYEPFVYLLKHCHFVLTDSGGIQEEAPSLGKPVLVMRDITERPEAVEAGTVELVGANKSRIVLGATRLFEEQDHFLKMSRAHNPYGDGRACQRIVEVLRNVQ